MVRRLNSSSSSVTNFLFFFHQFVVEPGRVRDVDDQKVEPPHIMFDHIQKLVALIIPFEHTQGADGTAQRGQRVFDLMRHIRSKLLVPINAIVKRRYHG